MWFAKHERILPEDEMLRLIVKYSNKGYNDMLRRQRNQDLRKERND